jgi:ankyrin repeat protein
MFPQDDDTWSFTHLHKIVVGIRPLDLDAQLLLSSNLEILNIPDARGRTPLHWATTKGDAPSVQSLLCAGADLSLIDHFGGTVLASAASAGNVRILESIIQRKVNIRSTNSRGDTALHYASRHQSSLRVVEILLKAGSDVNCRNHVGNTPITGAAITNKHEIGEYLLSHEANMHNLGIYGDTPLFETIYHNSHKFLQMLLSKGSRYTDLNYAGCSILHAAALEADVTTVNILASTWLPGLDPHLRNSKGETALDMLTKRVSKPLDFEAAFMRLLQKLNASHGSAKEKRE